LASIEEQLPIEQPSGLRAVVEAQMAANPGYSKDYYSGTEAELSILKTYSYSDRIRYYWTDE
jgi:D-tagatose-1,6-bisphosphate aldolase subunit GatZ/KbaZ